MNDIKDTKALKAIQIVDERRHEPRIGFRDSIMPLV